MKNGVDPVIKEVRKRADGPFTFSVKIRTDKVIDMVNAERPPEHHLEGSYNGITNGKVVIETDDGFKTYGDELWTSRFGGDVVEGITESDGFVRCRMFEELRLRRWVIEQVKQHSREAYLRLLKDDSGVSKYYSFYLRKLAERQ